MTTFEQLDRKNAERMAEWPNCDAIDLAFQGLEHAGECGELANVLKKIIRIDRGIAGTKESREELLAKAADEIGDIIICTSLIANTLALATGECAKTKFNKTSDKHGLKTKFATPSADQPLTEFIGTVWKHLKSGGVYEITGCCTIEASNTPAFLYRRAGESEAVQWARPVNEFLDGRFVWSPRNETME